MQSLETRSMGSYKDGLNFVPLLVHATPPSSGRTRLSMSARKSSISLPKSAVMCYNGNYEGDASMFGHGMSKSYSSRMDLIDTDSDTEYKKELEMYTMKQITPTAHSQLLRLWDHYKDRLLTAERLTQLTAFSEQVQKSYYYHKFWELISLGSALLIWCVRLLMIGLMRLSNWSSGVSRGRAILRNTARRLLWCMTLAKCGDASLFALILVTAPVLFIVALCGFVLSLYCTFKEWLSRSGYFIRFQAL